MNKRELRKALEAHPEYTLEQIGRSFGVSRQRVCQAVGEYKLAYVSKKEGPRVPLTLPKEMFLEAIANKHVITEFLATHGIGYDTFKRYLTHHNLNWPKTRRYETTDLVRLIKKHPEYTLTQLGEHFGVSYFSVQERVRRHKLPYAKKSAGRHKKR